MNVLSSFVKRNKSNVYPYDEMQLSNKKEQITDTHNGMILWCLKITVLSERSQTPKNTYHMIALY